MFNNMVRFGLDFSEGKKEASKHFPKGWTTLTKSYNISERSKNYAVLTGKINDITVVDLDKPKPKLNEEPLPFIELDWFEENIGRLSELNTLVTKSYSGGYHVYFKYTDKLGSTNKWNGMNIDILNNVRCCYQGEHYDIIHNKEIRSLTTEELNVLREGYKKRENKEVILHSGNEYNEEEIKEMIMGLSDERSDSYGDWMKIGYYLTQIKGGKEVFKDFSKKSEKYNKEEFESFWSSFKENYDEKKSIKVGTLLYWLEKDDIDLSNKYKGENSHQYNELIEGINKLTSVHDITNTKVLSVNNKGITTDIKSMKTFKILHDMRSKKCKRYEPYGDYDEKIGYLKCKNCKDSYPDEGMAMSGNTSTIIYNTINAVIVNNQDDSKLASNDTLTMAENILKEYNILYKGIIWYKYDEVTGIYIKLNRNGLIKLLSLYGKKEGRSAEIKDLLKNVDYKKRVIEEITSWVDISMDENIKLDENYYLLGFPNGVYDLKNKEFRKGKPEEYVTMVCGVEYDENADTSLADELLSNTFIEESEREYVLSKLSLCLEGVGDYQKKITFNQGYSASNGKSFLMEKMKKMMGDYGYSFPVTLLSDKTTAAGAANSSLVELYNKRFAYCSEPQSNIKLNVNNIKSLTGDISKARGMYQTSDSELNPTFNLYVCCNILPKFDSYDKGIERRIDVINYNTKFVENEYEVKRKTDILIKIYDAKEETLILKGLIKILISRYITYKSIPSPFEYIKGIFLADNRDEQYNFLKNNYEVGSTNDFIIINDVRKSLQGSDTTTLIFIMKELFPESEFFERKKIKGTNCYNVFFLIREKEDKMENDDFLI